MLDYLNLTKKYNIKNKLKMKDLITDKNSTTN
jgi:hypothetical protein